MEDKESRIKIRSFKDLYAWQEGHALVVSIYKLTKRFPKDELFGIVSQMRRAAVSITSNLAEGFGRGTYKDKAQFYTIAHGSVTELQNQLLVSKDVGYVDEREFVTTNEQAEKVERIIKALIKKSRTFFVFLLILYSSFLILPSSASASVIGKPGNNLGLVGYWSFNEGTSTIAHDFSGNGNNGLLSTIGSTLPQWVNGKFGKALSFDDSTNYVGIGSWTSEQTSYTISLWFNTTDPTGGGTLLFRGNYQACFYNPNIYVGGGVVDFQESGCSGSGEVASAAIAANTWYNAVFVRNGDTKYLYLNGVFIGQATHSSSPGTSSGNFLIAAGWGTSAGTQPGFPGIIDEVRTYNRPLSATEVAALYQSGSAKINASQNPGTLSNGLVGWWTMDGGDTLWTSSTAGNEIDKSGNGNTGAISNSNRSVSPVLGKVGQALFMGNTILDVASSTSINQNNQMSLSFWIKGTPSATAYQQVFWDEAPGDASGWQVQQSNLSSTIYLRIDTSAGSNQSFEGATVLDGKWHHVVFTLNNGSGTYYEDGVLLGSGTYSQGSGFSGYNDLIMNTSGYSNYFPFSLDDVRIYNRALSASEVKQLYTLGAGAHVNTSSANLQENSSLTSGLVGLWTFDGPTLNWTTGVAADQSGQGNNGQLVGMSTTTSPAIGKLGQGMAFNGSSSYLDIPNSSSLEPAAVTVSAWVNPSASTADTTCGGSGSGGGYIVFKRNVNTSSFEGYDLSAGLSGNQVYYCFGGTSSGGNQDFACSGLYNTNQWHQLTGTFQQPLVSLYVDGALAATTTHNYPLSYGSHDVFIGRTGECGGGGYANWDTYFTGKLDDVRIYNRALSASEVQQLYLMGK